MVVGGAVVGYGTGKLVGHLQEKHRINEYHKKLDRKKAGGIDLTLPENPFKDEKWEDISHPKANGHFLFKNKVTGETIEYDPGNPKKPGYNRHPHYHRLNPNTKNRHDKYLDANGRPLRNGSEPSHLYHPNQVWWE